MPELYILADTEYRLDLTAVHYEPLIDDSDMIAIMVQNAGELWGAWLP